MKRSALFTVLVVAASTSGFAWRNLELRSLRERVATLKENGGAATTTAMSDAAKTPEFDPAPIIKRAAAVFAQGGKSGPPAGAEELQQEILALPAASLARLAKAAAADATLTDEMRMGIAMVAAMALNETSPAEAVSLMASLPLTDRMWQKQIMQMLTEWILSDAAPATSWLKQALARGQFASLSEPDRTHMEHMVTYGSVIQDPIGELAAIRSAHIKAQNSLLEAGAKHLKTPEERRTFTAAVIAWPEAKIRRRALGPMLLRMLEAESFTPVADWLEALPDITDADRAGARLALATAQPQSQDLPERADWLMAHSEAGVRPEVASELVTTWIRHDYNAAGAWLNANKAAPWRDTAVHAFATGIAKTEPATAFEWAVTIADSGQRRNATEAIFPAWHRQDAAAANASLENSTLPADLKDNLRSAEK